MVHRSMGDGSGLIDELYIRSVLVVWDGFLFFSPYLFYCIAKQVTTVKLFQHLACPVFLGTNVEHPLSVSGLTFLLPI
jgi:hypothetical protein